MSITQDQTLKQLQLAFVMDAAELIPQWKKNLVFPPLLLAVAAGPAAAEENRIRRAPGHQSCCHQKQ